MGLIVNAESHANVYRNDVINQDQMNIDNSTVTNEDMNVYKEFAKQSAAYLQRKKPIYDFKTKNRSFIQLYKDLKKLGVQNNKFFLILYDSDLQLIDPYAPGLPKDYQLKVFLECLVNPWYFLREVLHIPADGMPIEIGGGVKYKIDRNNVAAWYCFLNGIDHYQSKPRQQGKTQDAVAKFNYAYLFGTLSSQMLFFNKDQDQANMNLYRLKCQRDMLPSYLQMRTLTLEDGKVDKGIENTKSIRNPVTGNTITTMGKATSKETAMKLGRGATSPLQYLDEFDFIPYQIEIMNAAAFAYSTASKNADEHHGLHCRILSSTPGDLDTKSGADATEYISHMLKWEDKFFDEPIDKIKGILNSPSYNRFMFIETTWQQLKLPMSWYETQCGLVSFNEEVIMREIELKRIHGSSLSPFKRSDIMYLINHVQHPIQQVDISKNLCPFNIYERLKYSTPYMLCVNPAEGLGTDNNAVTMINPYSLKPAMEFRSPYVSQPELFDMLVKFMDRYCPKCMIIIESNRGRELINLFLNSKYKYQLYYDDNKIMKEISDTVDAHGRLKQAASERRAYGLTTSKSNRDYFYGILEYLVEERKDILITEYLVDDIAGLIRKPGTGRVEAGPGKHDDNVMSFLFGMYLYRNLDAEKLEEYGIHRGAPDLNNDYTTEDGELTPMGKLQKLKEMLPGLPKEMQDIISTALRQRSEADDVMDAQKEIQKAMALTRASDPSMNTDIHSQTAYPQDEAYWANFDEELMDINEANQGTINIEDITDY